MSLFELQQIMNMVVESVRLNSIFILQVIAGLWVIHLVNFSLGYRLNYLGLVPRTPNGVLGILFAPFLHTSFEHIFANTVVLYVLAVMISINGMSAFFSVSIMIIVIGGLLTWLFARRAIHVGASGVIMGYWGYLLAQGYQSPSFLAVIMAGICIYFFGGLAMSLFPTDLRSSWEGHLFGFVAGIIASIFYLPLLGLFHFI